MKRYTLLYMVMTVVLGLRAEDNTSLYDGFQHPQDSARTKVWWFFGETPTTREGITADLEAFRTAGVGGVVYYDQVHGDGQGADELLSPKFIEGDRTPIYNKEEIIDADRIIDLTGLMAAAQVFVNGREAGTVWCSPWTLDITPYVKKGKNQLEIRVANSLWNRLVGDANKPEADRLMRQNYPLAKPDDRLTPSGLTGAVRIISQRP